MTRAEVLCFVLVLGSHDCSGLAGSETLPGCSLLDVRGPWLLDGWWSDLLLAVVLLAVLLRRMR